MVDCIECVKKNIWCQGPLLSPSWSAYVLTVLSSKSAFEERQTHMSTCLDCRYEEGL